MALYIGTQDMTYGSIICNDVDLFDIKVVANGTTQTVWQNYLTYTLLDDDTYSVKATNKEVLPGTVPIYPLPSHIGSLVI